MNLGLNDTWLPFKNNGEDKVNFHIRKHMKCQKMEIVYHSSNELNLLQSEEISFPKY